MIGFSPKPQTNSAQSFDRLSAGKKKVRSVADSPFKETEVSSDLNKLYEYHEILPLMPIYSRREHTTEANKSTSRRIAIRLTVAGDIGFAVLSIEMGNSTIDSRTDPSLTENSSSTQSRGLWRWSPSRIRA